MIELEKYDLTQKERDSLNKILEEYGNQLSLEQIWQIMDNVWKQLKCSQRFYSYKKYSKFYSHPIWLLNGIFIEQDSYSMTHRLNLSNAINSRKPKNVLDFGGGFGTLAKLISKQNNLVNVDIFEPYPSQHSISATKSLKKISFINSLKKNTYDIVVSTDVLEHVHDPLSLLSNLVKSIKKGGYIYIANCFSPVILCHLPCTFHLRLTFDFFCILMGLEKIGTCSNNYVQIYKRKSLHQANLFFIKVLEIFSKIAWIFVRPFRPLLRFILYLLR